MHLAHFIVTKNGPIAREWEEYVKTRTPAVIGMTRKNLLDDLTRILRTVVDVMEGIASMRC